MGIKKQRFTLGLDSQDKAFLEELVNDGTFRNLVDALRFCITLSRLYGIPAIKSMKGKES